MSRALAAAGVAPDCARTEVRSDWMCLRMLPTASLGSIYASPGPYGTPELARSIALPSASSCGRAARNSAMIFTTTGSWTACRLMSIETHPRYRDMLLALTHRTFPAPHVVLIGEQPRSRQLFCYG